MKFTVLTLFPEIPRAYFETSIMAKAVEKGIIAYDLVNIRDFAFDKHRTCDDSPYGGGAGQLIMPEPLGKALDSIKALRKHVIYVTPGGKPFTQKKAQELSRKDELVLSAEGTKVSTSGSLILGWTTRFPLEIMCCPQEKLQLQSSSMRCIGWWKE